MIIFQIGTHIGLGGQCGGTGYNGSTTCVSNLACYDQNFNYSWCEISCQAEWSCLSTIFFSNNTINVIKNSSTIITIPNTTSTSTLTTNLAIITTTTIASNLTTIPIISSKYFR